MQYTIVNGSEAEDVIQVVNERLQDGWELHGYLAISATPDNDGDLYAQAMVKADDLYAQAGVTEFRFS
jgi:hypothetical protein